MSDRMLDCILRSLAPKPGTKLWYGGSSVLGCLRGVDAGQAIWRPTPGRHSIWELILHIAYWKYAARRKLEDSPAGTFPRHPANWPSQPSTADAKQWARDRKLLKTEDGLLIAAIKAFDPGKMDRQVPGSKWKFDDLMMGVLTHDIYHTGQIVLMKRLYRDLVRKNGQATDDSKL